jgi:AcrR family transcriptional regulator
MPRSATDNLAIRDARRREILRAAARVFARDGVREARIGEIAREAGFSHGLIYHYFDSKDALFEAILEEKLERIREVSSVALEADGPILDRIARACELMIEQAIAEPELALVVTQAVVTRSLPDALRARLAETVQSAMDQTRALIAEGQRRGEITDEASPEELATALAAMLRGLALFQEVTLVEHPKLRIEVVLRLLRKSPLPPADARPERSAGRARRRRKEPPHDR